MEVQRIAHRFGRKIALKIEMRDLPPRMHPGIGAARSSGHNANAA